MKVNFFWFRRDLRLHDNAGLYKALKHRKNVQPVFIFDSNILNDLEDKRDPRVNFIYEEVKKLDEKLKTHGARLYTYYGKPSEVWDALVNEYDTGSVHANMDYEPYAVDRDENVRSILEDKGCSLELYKDHVIFHKDEVVKQDGDPYAVFTPYKNKWLEQLHSRKENGKFYYLKAYPVEEYMANLRDASYDMSESPTLRDLGFERSNIEIPSREISEERLKSYADNRDFPAREGTSRLGVHYRFGTISIREKARKALHLSDTYLNELIWREFYSQILYHHPKVVDTSFREKYDRIEWRNNEKEFQAWCEGKTGYPLVDAGMRQLNTTGYMHNRVRMVTASFLTKHLLIDWRWGEAYFAGKLLDYELASNNGGWQWAAGCGTDAAPYFRIFNPESQLKKFDPQNEYVKEYIEEWGTNDYPGPIVDHKEARERCLKTYKAALNNN